MRSTYARALTTLLFAIGLCAANVSFATYPGLARGVGRILENFAPPWLQEVATHRMFNGEWGGTMCLTESGAGTAVGDNRTEDTAAVLAALASCSSVTLPEGHTFLLRPVQLRSHSELIIDGESRHEALPMFAPRRLLDRDA